MTRSQCGKKNAERLLRTAMLVGSALLLSHCGAGVEGTVVYGYPATVIEVPPDIYDYPRVLYRGRYAYLVHDTWFYPSHRGWVRFRQEPRGLQRYRRYYYHDDLRFRRYRDHGSEYQPRRYYKPPPAYRTPRRRPEERRRYRRVR